MDPQLQTSFIPKKPLDTGIARHGSGTFGLFFLLALLIFITSLVAAGGAFSYQNYLQSQITQKSSQLQLSEGAYDPASIQDLLRLDSRINNAETLLAQHVAASAIFSFLSTQTLQNVSFTSFDYTLQADGSATVQLDGQADNFSTVALQSDQLGASTVLKNVVFSNITVNQNGGINFTVSANVNSSLLLYSNLLGSAASTAAPTVPAAATGTSTTP